MRHLIKHFLVPVLLMFSCADEANVTPDASEDEFFLELKVGTSTYRVSNQEQELNSEGYKLGCSLDDGWVKGYDPIKLYDTSEKAFIRSLSFTLSKKVFKDELDFQDDLSYTRKVVTAKTFGFPIPSTGFYEVYDPENNLFEVSRDVSAEAYLWLNTAEGVYRSTSTVPNTRDESSFLSIDKVVENDGAIAATYAYVVEGRFKVNLFKGYYGTTSEQFEGKFRLPVTLVPTSKIAELCQ